MAKCKKCRLYTKEYIQKYWVKCDKQCRIFTQKESEKPCPTKES